jgi:PAS domain S-box-containing protein
MALVTAKDAKESVPNSESAVLVIDPNEEHQVMSTMALGRRGFKVTITGTAREGLRIALSQPFQAIVLDLKVKDMPPLEVLSVLRERIPDVPKIVVVGVGQEQAAVRALASGASGYLVKTARYNELLPSEVEAQIRGARARRSYKEQKKALGESEERFQKAFRASPVALTIMTRDEGRLVDANDAFLALVGYSREELVGHTPAEAHMYQDLEASERTRREVKERGFVRELELIFRTKSGEVRTGVSSVESIEIEGEPCLLTILREVTEERRAERLRAAVYEISEATASAKDLPELFRHIHRTVAELMPAENFYIALHDPVTDTLSFPYFIDAKEATPAPYKLGKGLTEYVLRSGSSLLVTPEILDGLVAKGDVEKVGAEGLDWLGVPLGIGGRTLGVLVVQSYADTTRYTEVEKQLLEMVSAQVAMAIDRKRSDDALRSAEARFRTVFRDAPMGIALADLTGHILETNPAFQRMFGYPVEGLRGMHFRQLTHPDDLEQSLALFDEVARGGRPSYQAEKRYLNKDGQLFWGRITLTILKTQGPEPNTALVMIEDVTQEKEALQAREAAARRFQVLISKISDGISLVGEDGMVTWQSPSAYEMFGHPLDEVLGKSGLNNLHPDDFVQVAPGFADLMASPGKTMVAEVRIRHKDGTWRWTEVVGTNLLEDPDLHAVVFNYRDITQRNEALEQIRFQASLLNQVRNGVLATDADFRIVYWNDFACTMYGWKFSEVRGKSIRDFLLSPDARGSFDQTARMIRDSGHFEGERMMARKDGSRFPTAVSVTALRDRAGAVIGFVGVTVDISERAKARHDLEARAQQQAAIADLGQKALGEPRLTPLLNEALQTLTRTLAVEYASVLELDPDGTAFGLRAKVGWDLPMGTRIANDPGESLAAYTLVAKAPVIMENAATETRFKVPALFTDRKISSGITVLITGRTGPFGILSAHSKSPRAFSSDDLNFCTAIGNVIASAIERNRVEKVLAENDRLASMGQLAAYVAHEVNTPLTNISLLVSNIARRERDPEILEKLEAIGEQRRKATAIIMDLVDVPRQPTLRRVPEDLRTVIAAAVEQVGPYRKPEVSLRVETGDRAVFANIDTVQIRDVFVSLLRNALQATSQGSVTVRLSELPGFLFASVEDTGTGMPPEVVEQLFHPVYGAGSRTEGAPFGLAAIRGVVAAHGGKIEAVSEVGKGSTFTVILPRFEAR